jgi:hypothetical protein
MRVDAVDGCGESSHRCKGISLPDKLMLHLIERRSIKPFHDNEGKSIQSAPKCEDSRKRRGVKCLKNLELLPKGFSLLPVEMLSAKDLESELNAGNRIASVTHMGH